MGSINSLKNRVCLHKNRRPSHLMVALHAIVALDKPSEKRHKSNCEQILINGCLQSARVYCSQNEGAARAWVQAATGFSRTRLWTTRCLPGSPW